MTKKTNVYVSGGFICPNVEDIVQKLSGKGCTVVDGTNTPLTMDKTPLEHSLEFVKNADVVLLDLAEIDSDDILMESMVEIAFAAYLNKQVVLVIEEGNTHECDLLLSDDCVSFSTPCLDKAYDYIRSFADGKEPVHDRAFPTSNNRNFNLLVQIVQNLSKNGEDLHLNLRGYKKASVDVLFLLALCYVMNVKSILTIDEDSDYGNTLIHDLVTEFKSL